MSGNSDVSTAGLSPGQVGDNELRLLRIFQAVARCGGISAAEMELNLGRSVISRHLKDLEIRLGVILCQRDRSGFRLTSEGERVLAAACPLFAAVDGFRTEVGELKDQLRGRLRIALFDKTITNGAAQLTAAIALFDRQTPKVRLEVHVEPTNLIEAGVLDGSFDLGVIPTHRDSPSLRYHHLFQEAMFLYCGQGHPLFGQPREALTVARVRACKYAGIGFHSPNMRTALALGLERQADAFDQEAIATLILSGCYLGFLPAHYAAQFEAQALIRRLRPDLFHYRCDFAAIHRRSPAPARTLACFVDCLLQAHAGEARQTGRHGA